MLSKNWPDGMNDMLGRQLTGGRDYCFTCRQTVWISCLPDFATGFDDCRPTNTMYGAVDARAAHQRRIRRVDDGINVLLCDIADDYADRTVDKTRTI